MTPRTPHPTLRKAKITEADLPLFARHHITDWSGQVFEREALLFKALGGGATHRTLSQRRRINPLSTARA